VEQSADKISTRVDLVNFFYEGKPSLRGGSFPVHHFSIMVDPEA
jgi:hypothetical protein